MVVRRTDTKKILAGVLARLEPSYTLNYISHDDRLYEEQIQEVFDWNASDVEDAILENLNADLYYENQIIKDLVPDGVERAALRSSDEYYELVEAIQERDDATPFADLVQHSTWSMLLRYRLGPDEETFDLPQLTGYPADGTTSATTKHARRLARLAGVDFEPNRKAFEQMVIEQSYYGGRLYVMWYAEPRVLLQAAVADQWHKPRRRTITWKDPHLILLDTWNGTGYGETISGTVTKRWESDRCKVDKVDGPWGWQQIAGPHPPAYKCDWSLDLTADLKRRAKA